MDRINKLLHGLLVRAWTLIIITFAGILPAKVITVSPDGPTTSIQSAVEAADSGDEIIVEPGIYNERIRLTGKDFILRSTDPMNWDVVTSTVIDQGGDHDGIPFFDSGTVVRFEGSETEAFVLSGFTITGGFVDESMYEKGAAGIEGSGCFATIRNNLVTENHGRGILMSTGQGGVFYNGGDGGLRACRGLIENNIITKNTTLGSGGGLNQCNGTIQNNEITSNSAFTLGGLGGGIFSCNGSILNNKIQYNFAASGGGGVMGGTANIIGNTITHNRGVSSGGGIRSSFGIISHNVIAYNAANIGTVIRDCPNSIINNFIYKNFSSGSGSAIVNAGGEIIGNTIVDNITSGTESEGGSGLKLCFGLIQNNIIWNNGDTSKPQILFSSTPQNCIIENWTGVGEGIITSPPLFVDPENDNYHLLSSSPAIDTGGDVPFITDFKGNQLSFNTDFEGDARPFDVPGVGFDGAGTGFDIGADEFLPAFFFIREHILGKQLTDDETSDTLNTNQDALIDTSDILNSI